MAPDVRGEQGRSSAGCSSAQLRSGQRRGAFAPQFGCGRRLRRDRAITPGLCEGRLARPDRRSRTGSGGVRGEGLRSPNSFARRPAARCQVPAVHNADTGRQPRWGP